MEIGDTLTWQRARSTGTLSVAAIEDLQGMECKRLALTLTGAAGSAQREGLVCFGRANCYAGSPERNEVY